MFYISKLVFRESFYGSLDVQWSMNGVGTHVGIVEVNSGHDESGNLRLKSAAFANFDFRTRVTRFLSGKSTEII